MKIKINYDLLTKINEAEKGLSLKKSTKTILLKTGIGTGICTVVNIAASMPEEILPDFLFLLGWFILSESLFTSLLSKINKKTAIQELKDLAYQLKSINVNVDYESLLKSNVYQTEYKFDFKNSIIPKIKQNKYIMVTENSDINEREVSLVQEHIIGTKEYCISYGSPKKVFKPSFNTA